MKTKSTTTLHHLPVLSAAEAEARGFVSITVNINGVTEKPILAGVAQFRDPERAAFIRFGDDYQLAIRREDVRHVDPE